MVLRCVVMTSLTYFRTHYHLVWNLACGVAQNESQLLVFRFLSGLGSSAPLAVCNACRVALYSINRVTPDRRWSPRRLLACRRAWPGSRCVYPSTNTWSCSWSRHGGLVGFRLSSSHQLSDYVCRIAERSTWRWVVCPLLSKRYLVQ